MYPQKIVRSFSIVVLALILCAPVDAQIRSRSRSVTAAAPSAGESRSSITIVEDGKTRKYEILKKDGKVLLNGKPIEEADAEDREWYEKHVFDGNDARARVYMNQLGEFRSRANNLTFAPDDSDVTVYFSDDEDGAISDTSKVRRRVRVARPVTWQERPFEVELPKVNFPAHIAKLEDLNGLTGFAFGEGFDGDVMRLENEARDLARQMRNASEGEKRNLEAKLDSKLDDIFEKKQENRRKSVERLEEKLRAEREALEGRERAKRDLMERRKRELLGKEDPMRW